MKKNEKRKHNHTQSVRDLIRSLVGIIIIHTLIKICFEHTFIVRLSSDSSAHTTVCMCVITSCNESTFIKPNNV